MKNFNEIYEAIYKQSGEKLENARKRRLSQVRVSIIIVIAFIVLLMVMFKNVSVLFALLPILIFIVVIFSLKGNEYSNIFKKEVISVLVKEYSETLEYLPQRGLSSSIYDKGMFEGYDRYRSEDLITGMLDGHEINMAEVHTQDESTDSEGHTSTTTVFHGLFAEVKLDREIPTVIRIRRNGLSLFGNKEKIEMDSGEFEKIFNVYAKDKIIAMQLLTADVMQMFIDFKNDNKLTPELTIYNNNLYIRFEAGNVFEAKLSKKAMDYEVLKKHYDMIHFILRLVEEILKNIKEIEI